ncbi:MAG: hypothetical protein M4579_004291 [Chaenotheca gracillima]|nr:MAG: hypothetical protein M4579_004291 [Chaenotheca gracillima]
MTLDVLRDGILRSKRDELTYTVSSRKRKLRELYAVARSTEPVPQHPGLNNDLLFDDGERAFLSSNDILKGRSFDESTLPPRSQYILQVRSKVPGGAPSPAHELAQSSQKLESLDDAGIPRGVHGDIPTESGRGSSSARDDSVLREQLVDTPKGDGVRDAPVSRALQTTPSRLGVAPGPQGSLLDRGGARRDGHSGRAAVDPSRVGSEASEDIAHEAGESFSSSNTQGVPKGAATVNFNSRHGTPSRATPPSLQTSQLKTDSPQNTIQNDTILSHHKGSEGDSKQDLESLAPGHRSRRSSPLNINAANEPLSSPSSTIEPYSANTPGVHHASTETSPDHEVIADRSEAIPAKSSPGFGLSRNQESQNTPQMNVAHVDNVGRSPSSADAQLRFEEEQAKRGDSHGASRRPSDDAANPPQSANQGKADDSGAKSQVARNDGTLPRTKSTPDGLAGDSSTRTSENGLQQSPFGLPNSRTGPTTMDSFIQEESLSKATSPVDLGPVLATASDVLTDPALASPDSQTKRTPDVVTREESTRPSTKQRSGSTLSQSERMTTRVSSGAIRHKSVSEILGEKPKPIVASPTEQTFAESEKFERANLPSQVSSPSSEIRNASQSSALIRSAEMKERERTKLSTIIFAKQDPSKEVESSALARMDPSEATQELAEGQRDYLLPLFTAQASSHTRSQPLTSLLSSAHKTLTTSNHYVDFHEQQDCRILKRIYQLQYANRWSLRQMERAAEPSRPVSHWDVVLDHMKWMQTDFKEERKWKLTVAKNLAMWCSAWVAADEADRARLQVRVKRPSPLGADVLSREVASDIDMEEMHTPDAIQIPGHSDHRTPELVPSTEEDPMSDSIDGDETFPDLRTSFPPASIFSLAPDSVAIAVEKTPSSERLMDELPLYEAALQVPSLDKPSTISPDRSWKLPMAPISKFVQGKMIAKEHRPPRKRSRYEFEEEDEEAATLPVAKLEGGGSIARDESPERSSKPELKPEQNDVALFNSENQHIKDRMHAGHAFRPPWEFGMPSQSFFECRQSSQWTWAEDSELRSLVKEYSFNWSLISSMLSSSSLFSSGAERRTPWECFERWINLDSIPADMQKTQYFRAYYARLEAAKHTLMAQAQAPQQMQGNNAMAQVRTKRTAQPVRVERRKNSKHLALIDAMRKLAKKRENSLQKQQHAAGVNASRKANNAEAAHPWGHECNPHYLSQVKFDREVKLQEKAEAFRQTIMQRNALMQQQQQQRSAQHANSQQYGQQNGGPQQQRPNGSNPSHQAAALAAASAANHHGQPGYSNQSRLQPPPQGLPNGQMGAGTGDNHGPPQVNGNSHMPMKGMPQAMMQPTMGQHRPQQQITPEMRLWMENKRIEQEQRRFLERRQNPNQPPYQGQQQHNGHSASSASPNMNNMNGGGAHMNIQNNPALMAAIHANSNGFANNGNNLMPSASPQMAHNRSAQNSQPQQLSSGLVPTINQISHQIKSTHPGASPDQIQKMTSEQLGHYQARLSQLTINHAAGAGNNQHGQMNMMNGSAAMANPQMYAQMIRSQQANQSGAGNAGSNGPGPPSRSATPHTQRSGSVQAPQGSNQSPRPPQAQMAGGQ